MERMDQKYLWKVMDEILIWLNIPATNWHNASGGTYRWTVFEEGHVYVTRGVRDSVAYMNIFCCKEDGICDTPLSLNYLETITYSQDGGIEYEETDINNVGFIVHHGEYVQCISEMNVYTNVLDGVKDIAIHNYEDDGMISPAIASFFEQHSPTAYDGIVTFPLEEAGMSYNDLEIHYDAILHKARKIFTSKNKDYATSADALAGFRNTAEKAGITPLQTWSVFSSKHIAAIDAYVSGHSEESEPIEGRIADVINFMCFLYAIIKDKE